MEASTGSFGEEEEEESKFQKGYHCIRQIPSLRVVFSFVIA